MKNSNDTIGNRFRDLPVLSENVVELILTGYDGNAFLSHVKLLCFSIFSFGIKTKCKNNTIRRLDLVPYLGER
jgi:hypothetical protein